MTISHEDRALVLPGDCLAVLAALPDAIADAVITDPPYGLGFMGKEWDQPDQFGSTRRGGEPRSFKAGAVGHDHHKSRERSASMHAGQYDLSPSAMLSFQRWCEAWARECLRVLKPGGHLLAFGGTRTYHRLTAGIEDAGFEIRDSIHWIYGSGFPKSLDVSKAIDKAAGTEREVIGERDRYRDGKVRQNLGDRNEVYGKGLTANGVASVTAPATEDAQRWDGWGTALKPAHEPIVVARKPLAGTVAANVLQHGAGALNIDACRVEHASAADLAESKAKNPGRTDVVTSEVYGAGRPQQSVNEEGRWPANVMLDEDAAAELDEQSGIRPSGGSPGGVATNTGMRGNTFTRERPALAGDSGGASRFFPVFRYQAKAPTKERPSYITEDGRKIAHPTCKPLELMRWLLKLVTPPDGLVLDPFAGSGTTVEAALLEGFRALAIEREADYLPLIQQRIDRVPTKKAS